jgi:hypothetical protein
MCINTTGINNREDLDKLKQIKEHDHSPVEGHPGRANILELIKRNHQWQGMRKDVDRYVQNSHICQCSKSRNQMTHGWLKRLEVPQQLLKDLSIDFVVGLPESNGDNTI